MCPIEVGLGTAHKGPQKSAYAAAEQKCTFDFSKTVSTRSARLGEVVTVTLTIKNTSTTNAVTLTGAVATDDLGDQPVTFTMAGSDPACKHDGKTDTVSCTFGKDGQLTLQPGQSASLQFNVKVQDLDSVPAKGRKVMNKAKLDCTECGQKGIVSEAQVHDPSPGLSLDPEDGREGHGADRGRHLLRDHGLQRR